MDTLKQTVRKVVEGYTGKALNGYSYLTQSDDGTLFTVVDVSRVEDKHFSGVSLVVRIFEDVVIIERDQNNKLMVDTLIQAGITRDKIILAYAGESVPEGAI